MSRPSQVVPAILAEEPKALELMVRQAEAFASWVQFDIMDSRFVPSRSISHEHLARLPMKLGWEAHLMVERPEEHLAGFREAGAQKVVFHYEAVPSPQGAISLARSLGLKVGLALNPETPASAILPWADEVDSVLFLSVPPGFYGRQFIPEVLDKLVQFRSAWPGVETGIDGGINESNIAQVARAGVDFIYVGSAIFAQPDPAASFHRLQALAQKGKPGRYS